MKHHVWIRDTHPPSPSLNCPKRGGFSKLVGLLTFHRPTRNETVMIYPLSLQNKKLFSSKKYSYTLELLKQKYVLVKKNIQCSL